MKKLLKKPRFWFFAILALLILIVVLHYTSILNNIFYTSVSRDGLTTIHISSKFLDGGFTTATVADSAYFDDIIAIDDTARKHDGVNPMTKCAIWELTLTYTYQNGDTTTHSYRGQSQLQQLTDKLLAIPSYATAVAQQNTTG